MANKPKHSKLRKQPKRRRTYSSSAVNYPRVNVPKTAKKRRRRQRTEGVRIGLSTLKRIVFSSRWISLGLLALTIYALVIIVQEKRFYLTYIPVDGAVSFSSEEIVAASNLAGIHIFSANPSQAADNITDIPGVISSTVSLKWPNQVYIEIDEEDPVAVWQEDGNSYGITSGGRLVPVSFPLTGLLQIIADSGSVTAPPPIVVAESEEDAAVTEEQGAAVEAAEAEVDPAETVAEPVQAEADNTSSAEETAVDNTTSIQVEVDNQTNDEDESEIITRAEIELETSITFVPQEVLLGALSLQELRPSIGELYYRASDGLSYQDPRGWRVHFGTGNDMNQKLVLYETILNELQMRGLSPLYISVSNKSKPHYLAY